MQTVTEITDERINEIFPGFLNGEGIDVEKALTKRAIKKASLSLKDNWKSSYFSTLTECSAANSRCFKTKKRHGRQYHTDVGIIDLLARDPSDNSYMVIELKRDKSSDVVVGQTLRYMGWVKQNLCTRNEDVRGRIICVDSDERLRHALSMVPSIDIRYYRVDFQLFDSLPI